MLLPTLRETMQTILDEVQSDETDELKKVSLERLASIDPDLLIKIKQTAEDAMRSGANGSTNSTMKSHQPNTSGDENNRNKLNFLIETRTSAVIERTKTWEKAKIDVLKDTNDIVANLQQLVRDSSDSETSARYTQIEAIGMTSALSTAAATAGILSSALQKMQTEVKKASKNSSSSLLSGGTTSSGGTAGTGSRGLFRVDKKLFTNEGLKKKNESVIAILYEVGLPFVSSSDGRRFATQIELSKHLDALFKKG